MGKMKIVAIATVSALLPAAAANAADLPPRLPPLPPIVQKAPIIEEMPSGWYLRGDFGYRFNMPGTVTSAIAPDPTGNRIDDAFALGLGVGYKWSWFRSDLTFDYAFSSSYSGNTPGFTPDFTAKIQSVTGLANVYADLGTWSGITPYIGGGFGGAYLRASDFVSASVPVAGVSSDRWNFAWAAMGGFSYSITQNLLFDLGYRYLDQGKAVTGLSSAGDQLTIKNLTSHELRAGVRWAM